MSAEDFQAKYKVPKPKPDDNNITFHCHSGRRAQSAIAVMQELGYERYSRTYTVSEKLSLISLK